MRVLITGNAGYVGPVLVSHLRRTQPGWHLTGLDSGLFWHALSGSSAIAERLLDEQIFLDVRDVEADVFKDVDAVIHLAALSNDPMGKTFEQLTQEINLEAATRVATFAREAGVGRFVFASSCSMYGASGATARVETDSLEPLTAYARSKVAFERILERLARPGFTVTCLRFATACGVSPRTRMDLVLNDFVATAVTQGQVKVLSDGTPWRPLIDVRDMARALEWAAEDRLEVPEQFLAVNVGSSEWNYQVRDIAGRVAELVNGAVLSFSDEAPADNRSYTVDFARFRELAPHHQPSITLEESIEALVKHVESDSLPERWARQGSFSRLHELRRMQDSGLLSSELRWTELLQGQQ